jgi:hypothetical protein
MTYKQKPLTLAQQRAHRAALKGFRGDNTAYVTRKVTKAACGNVDVVAPLKVRAFAVDTLDLNDWTNDREFMRELSDKRWNGFLMEARNAR